MFLSISVEGDWNKLCLDQDFNHRFIFLSWAGFHTKRCVKSAFQGTIRRAGAGWEMYSNLYDHKKATLFWVTQWILSVFLYLRFSFPLNHVSHPVKFSQICELLCFLFCTWTLPIGFSPLALSLSLIFSLSSWFFCLLIIFFFIQFKLRGKKRFSLTYLVFFCVVVLLLPRIISPLKSLDNSIRV